MASAQLALGSRLRGIGRCHDGTHWPRGRDWRSRHAGDHAIWLGGIYRAGGRARPEWPVSRGRGDFLFHFLRLRGIDSCPALVLLWLAESFFHPRRHGVRGHSGGRSGDLKIITLAHIRNLPTITRRSLRHEVHLHIFNRLFAARADHAKSVIQDHRRFQAVHRQWRCDTMNTRILIQ